MEMKGRTMKDIYGKLLKEWGGFQIGDVVRFGRSKFDHLAADGIVEKTHKQRALNDPEPPAELKVEPKPKEPPVIETATAEPPENVETAEVTPRRRGRPKKGGD